MRVLISKIKTGKISYENKTSLSLPQKSPIWCCISNGLNLRNSNLCCYLSIERWTGIRQVFRLFARVRVGCLEIIPLSKLYFGVKRKGFGHWKWSRFCMLFVYLCRTTMVMCWCGSFSNMLSSTNILMMYLSMKNLASYIPISNSSWWNTMYISCLMRLLKHSFTTHKPDLSTHTIQF